jgi:outer membrane biosynthesis protein TonB
MEEADVMAAFPGRTGRVLIVGACLALSAACATTHAKTKMPEAPALDPPPPPPRVIAPLEADEETVTSVTTMPDEPAHRTPPARPAARPQPREGRAEPPKSETPKTEEPAKPPEGPEPAPAPVHRLQPANEAEQERSIQNRIATAERDLARTDYRKLTAEVKNQYDTAKRLVEQAKDALKSRNFVFADSLADKAEKIAASLKPPLV